MKAQYLQPTGTVVLDVIGKPKAGLADLGRGQDILVKGVPVSTEPKMGSCFLIEEEDPKAALKAAAKAAREKATQLSKAAADAAKAAAAALGKEGHDALAKSAAEAAEAAKLAAAEAEEAEAAAK